MSGEPFAVIVKPVGSRCNMRCRYCYYLEKEKISLHEKQTVMSDEMLERLIQTTIAASPGPTVSFIWHGGEPTLAGLDFYRRAAALQKKLLPPGWQAWNNLQTNGLLLNKGWCDFLRREHFDVGVSIDGSELVHDKNRLDAGGQPTYARVRRAIARLRDNGIEPDLLCTVTSDSAAEPEETYRALKELGTGWIQFIPVLVRLPEGGFTPESVTPEQYGRFLCEIFDEWRKNDLGKVDVQLFAETARTMAGGKPALCTLGETCGRVLVAEEDGSVYACDHFVDREHRLGSFMEEELRALANSAAQLQFGLDKRDTLTRQCRECPYLKLCGGGCMKDRDGVSRDGEPGQYALCEGLKLFYAHAQEPLECMMRWSRQGLSPDEMMRKWK